MGDGRQIRLRIMDSTDGPEPTEAEDRAILDLIEEGQFKGPISLLYTRRPSPWRSFSRDGQRVRLLTAWDFRDNRLMGMGAAVSHMVWDGSQPREMHYLCGFRVRRQGRWSLRFMPRAYSALMDACGSEGLFLTSILRENEPARRLLEKPRASLPTYCPLGEFTTVALRARSRGRLPIGLRWRQAQTADVSAMTALMRAQGRRRPLFPVVTEDRLLAADGVPGLADFVLVHSDAGSLMACGALLDQSGWKQYVVMGYHGLMAWARPLSGLLFPILGYPPLPPAGTTLTLPVATLLATATDDPVLMRALLTALSQTARDSPMFLAGCIDTAPEAEVLRELRGVRYRSLVYQVRRPGHDPDRHGGESGSALNGASISRWDRSGGPHVELAHL